MSYKIVSRPDIEDYEESDNARAAKDDLDRLRHEFPGSDYIILRDEVEISEIELGNDLELQADRTKSSKLPAGSDMADGAQPMISELAQTRNLLPSGDRPTQKTSTSKKAASARPWRE